MKKLLALNIFLLLTRTATADSNCLLVKNLETGKIVKQEGQCEMATSPCSTFKVALSVMGFDDKILIDSAHPEWPYKKEYNSVMENHRQAHTPSTWIRDSVVWYSQVMTKKMGEKKFKNYVEKFDYGNKDVSGDPGKHNGLTNAWLSSSLKITPTEQINLLSKLIQNKLPASVEAQEKTRELLYSVDLQNGWKLYGKTGTGHVGKQQLGWFVGWVTKNKTTLVFVRRTLEDEKLKEAAGPRAKGQLKELLKENGYLN